MKKRFAAAFVLAVLAGILQHFLHEWLPIPLTALFAPVNESVWEHLKLLYWPFLLAAILLTRRMRELPRAWSAFLASLLLMPLVLTSLYYLLKSGFGLESAALDIALYLAVMAFGFLLSYHLYDSGAAERRLGGLIVLSALYGVALIVFSVAAPPLPIFQPPV